VSEVTVSEGGAEMLDVVRSLWLSMFEWHRSLPPEASSAIDPLPADEALERRFTRFRRELGDSKVTLFLVNEGEEPVAFALVRIRPEGEASFATGAGVVEVDAMSVAPSHRDRGLGSLLLRRVHEWAAERGIGYVSLSVMAGNEEAERFYRRFGMARSVVRMLGPVQPSQDDGDGAASRERT
jgi:diamine N-acetyltransferase